MKTIELKLYTINELPTEEAKEKARDWWKECASGDTFWSECTIDEAVEQGSHLGITFSGKNPIMFSGFSSQGDGACFVGTWKAVNVQAEEVAQGWGDSSATVEIKRIAAEFDRLAKKWPQAQFGAEHTRRYCHENSVSFDVEIGEGVEDSNIAIAEEELKEAARDFMRWIYARLEESWDYTNSNEQVDENIKANEYMFLEDGTRFES